MDKLVALTILALVNKQVIELLKGFKIVEKYPFLFSIGTGLAMAFTISIDLLVLAGFQVNNPIVGVALTGLAIGSGSNAIFDLLNRPALEVIEIETTKPVNVDVNKDELPLINSLIGLESIEKLSERLSKEVDQEAPKKRYRVDEDGNFIELEQSHVLGIMASEDTKTDEIITEDTLEALSNNKGVE